jgi:hypothetical protein
MMSLYRVDSSSHRRDTLCSRNYRMPVPYSQSISFYHSTCGTIPGDVLERGAIHNAGTEHGFLSFTYRNITA